MRARMIKIKMTVFIEKIAAVSDNRLEHLPRSGQWTSY